MGNRGLEKLTNSPLIFTLSVFVLKIHRIATSGTYVTSQYKGTIEVMDSIANVSF